MLGSTFVLVSCVERPLPSLLLIHPLSSFTTLLKSSLLREGLPSLLLLPIHAAPFPSRALALWITSGTVSLGGCVKGTQTRDSSGCFLYSIPTRLCNLRQGT